MYLMKTVGAIKSWTSLIWHNFVKIDVFEKLANFEDNFEGEGCRYAKIDRTYQERGGSELSEYQIRFSVALMVSSKMSTKIDLFLRILVYFLTFSVPLRIPINPDFLENTVEVK